MIATASGNRVRFWSLSGEPLDSATFRGTVYSLVFSPQGRSWVVEVEGMPYLMNSQHDPIALPDRSKFPTGAIAYGQNGEEVITGSNSEMVYLWTSSGAKVAEMRGHRSIVTGVAQLARASMILSASEDGTVRLWDRNGSELFHFGNLGTVTDVAVSPTGGHIAAVTREGSLFVWAVDPRNLLRTVNAARTFGLIEQLDTEPSRYTPRIVVR
jgi:WD40 repeat protein